MPIPQRRAASAPDSASSRDDFIRLGGTALAQQHLRNVPAYLDVPVLSQPEVFIHFKDDLIADDGTIHNEGTTKFLQGFMDHYVAWVRRFAH